jgi:hypothetical protein
MIAVEEWAQNEEVVIPQRTGGGLYTPPSRELPSVWTQQWPVERPKRRPTPTVIVEPIVETKKEIPEWDPILIALVRRAMPNLIAYDICGVQPMTGPTGLIFAMRSKYDTGKQRRKERYKYDE